MKPTKRKCPRCGEVKFYRADQVYCSKKCVKEDTPVLTEKVEVQGDKWEIVLPKTRIHTLEQLLKFFQVDLSVWEVERFICNKWEMGFKDKNDEADSKELYQVKAFLRKKKEAVFAKSEIASLREQAIANAVKPPSVRVVVKANGSKMLLVNLTDHHFGKLAWAFETGFANYDAKIATAVGDQTMSALFDRPSNYDCEEIWFVL